MIMEYFNSVLIIVQGPAQTSPPTVASSKTPLWIMHPERLKAIEWLNSLQKPSNNNNSENKS